MTKRSFRKLSATLVATAALVLIGAGPAPAIKQVTLAAGAKPAVVPDGKVWKVTGLSPYSSESGIGTADVTVDGQMLVGENNGLTVAGKFDVSINNNKHPNFKILSGSKVSVGDSRKKLAFREEAQ